MTWVVIANLLVGLIIGGTPDAWLELRGIQYTGEEMIRASRDLGFMQIALAMGGFFVLWSGPRRQLPILVTLTVATFGLGFNLWTMDWQGPGEAVWKGLAMGSLIHMVLLMVVISRWWKLLRMKAPEPVGEEEWDEELTEAATVSVQLGSDEPVDEGEDEAPVDAPWLG